MGMLIAILPLLALSTTPDDGVVITSPRAAQARLADALADADSIESVHARAHTITFRIARTGNAFDLIAKTNRDGEVIAVTTRDRGHAEHEIGNLSWLVDAMKETTAVTQLGVDEDGAVTLVTIDGTRYMAIPGRGSGGNDAVEARFASAFDR